MFEAPRPVPPRRRALSVGNLILSAVTVVAVAASAHVAQLVEVPYLPAIDNTPAQHAGWAAPGPAPAPAPAGVPDPGAERSVPETTAPLVPAAPPAPAHSTQAPGGDTEAGPPPDGSTPSDGPVSPPELVAAACSSCDTYYVDNQHPSASDSNPGTSENAPWRTIVHAGEEARAGDTVLVKEGVYDDGFVDIEHSGQSGAPIVFAAFPGDERKAVITNAGIRSTGKSHLEIRDFKITNSPAHGIRVEGPEDAAAPPARNIVITGNHTRYTCSSGVSVWGVDWGDDPGDYDNIRNVEVSYNLLEFGTTGCKGEIITVAGGAVNVDVHHNTIRRGDPAMKDGDEGIDFKEGVRDSKIRDNLIYDLSDKGIYIDGGSGVWDPQVKNIEITGNMIHDVPSHGISIVTEGRGDVDGIYVANNVIHSVDGDGLIVYAHPGGTEEGGTVRNVQFVNNTVVDSGLRHGGHGGIRVNHPTATGIVIRNNVVWGNNGYDVRGESETTIDHNLCRESFCAARAEPAFADESIRDYRLTIGSPAIDLGASQLAPATDFNGAIRPAGEPQDAGAFDASYLASSLPKIVPGGLAIAEGDDGTTRLEIPVRLTQPAAHEVRASWYVYPYHAELDVDVKAKTGEIVFAPGQTETVMVVKVIGDLETEGPEWFFVPVHDPTGAEMGGFYGLGLGLIVDDD